MAQLLLVAVYAPDSAAPLDEIAPLARELGIGGIVLQTGSNVFVNRRGEPLPAHIAQLTADIQRTALARPDGVPLFIAVDHEGNGAPLTHLREGFTALPSAMSIGATWDPANAAAVGEITGRELAAVGVNVVLGPVLDVLASTHVDNGGDIGTRAFGGHPYWVGRMGSAYVAGVHAGSGGRVLTVAKHFPGHGGSDRLPEMAAERAGAVLELELEAGGQRDHVGAIAARVGDEREQHVARLDLRRVHVTALDFGNITQAQLVAPGTGAGAVARTPDGQGAQVFHGLKLAGHSHLQGVQRGLDDAGAFNGVLLAELGQHLVHVDAQLRQPLLRDLDEDALGLHAVELHLGHVLHAQQPAAHALGMLAQLLGAEAVGREREDRAVDVAEVVVEQRADHAARQRRAPRMSPTRLRAW